MRWDDFQILKVIDECEGSDLGPLANGLNLLGKVGQGKQIDGPREAPFFARELVLARQEGYLEFDDRVGHGMRLADPRSDASSGFSRFEICGSPSRVGIELEVN